MESQFYRLTSDNERNLITLGSRVENAILHLNQITAQSNEFNQETANCFKKIFEIIETQPSIPEPTQTPVETTPNQFQNRQVLPTLTPITNIMPNPSITPTKLQFTDDVGTKNFEYKRKFILHLKFQF